MPADALWRDDCESAMARRLRKRSSGISANALLRDDCGNAMARPLRRRYGASLAMARRLRKRARYLRTRYCETAEALWRIVCGSALAHACGSAVARRLWKRSGETSAHMLWRDACGSAMTRRLRRRYGASYAEALRTRCDASATPTEALWRSAEALLRR